MLSELNVVLNNTIMKAETAGISCADTISMVKTCFTLLPRAIREIMP